MEQISNSGVTGFFALSTAFGIVDFRNRLLTGDQPSDVQIRIGETCDSIGDVWNPTNASEKKKELR